MAALERALPTNDFCPDGATLPPRQVSGQYGRQLGAHVYD